MSLETILLNNSFVETATSEGRELFQYKYERLKLWNILWLNLPLLNFHSLSLAQNLACDSLPLFVETLLSFVETLFSLFMCHFFCFHSFPSLFEERKEKKANQWVAITTGCLLLFLTFFYGQ